MIETCFDRIKNLEAVIGESSSFASKRRKSSGRAISSLEAIPRTAYGHLYDLVFRMYDVGYSIPCEFGASEVGMKNDDITGTKSMNEGFYKLPRTLKDMLDYLLTQVDYNKRQASLRKVGFVHFGLASTLIELDRPTTYIAKSIIIDGCNPDFIQGQPYLESVSRQPKVVNLYVDDKNQYKSDGLVKLFGLNKLDLLLLETSGSFSNKDKNKGKLNHYKGVYEALAMFKCIVDNYPYATLKAFAKVKVFFLHVAGKVLMYENNTIYIYFFYFQTSIDTELYFWSVCYHNEGIFDL